MLTELSRVNVAANFQGGTTAVGAYIWFPACASVGSALIVGDLEWQHGNAQIILRLFGPFGAVNLTPQELAAQAPLGLWLYQTPGGAIGASVLHMPDDLGAHPPALLTLAIDPASGAILNSADQATGMNPLYSPHLIPTPYVHPSFVEEYGDGSLLLRRYVLSYNDHWDDREREFRVRLTSAGEATFDDPVVQDLDPQTVHGVSLDRYGQLSNGTDTVRVPPPAGWSPGSAFSLWPDAAMWRQHGGEVSLVLSLGSQILSLNPLPGYGYFLAYDLCVYSGGPPLAVSSWWEGELRDDGWHPDWGSGTLVQGIIPQIQGDRIVLTNPAAPDDPWAWATLPPGAGLNDWMAFYVDGDWVQVHYGGRVVLVWRMPPSVYQHFLAEGASMGFYNSITKQWQAEPPPGWPPAKPAPLNGWAYLVDSRHWVSETGDLLTRYGTRIDADDVLVFPGDYALVGQALQDDVIQSAPIKHIAGRDLPEVVLSRDDALLVWDAGYGHYLYPVEEAP